MISLQLIEALKDGRLILGAELFVLVNLQLCQSFIDDSNLTLDLVLKFCL